MRPGEDPAVYKWELQQLLCKANPTLAGEAKTALLERQFMRGLPFQTKLQLFEHNPVLKLQTMIQFVQLHRGVELQVMSSRAVKQQGEAVNENNRQPSTRAEILELAAAVKELATGQKELWAQFSRKTERRTEPTVNSCFKCRLRGHLACECRVTNRMLINQSGGNFRYNNINNRSSTQSSRDLRNIQCFSCHQFGQGGCLHRVSRHP